MIRKYRQSEYPKTALGSKLPGEVGVFPQRLSNATCGGEQCSSMFPLFRSPPPPPLGLLPEKFIECEKARSRTLHRAAVQDDDRPPLRVAILCAELDQRSPDLDQFCPDVDHARPNLARRRPKLARTRSTLGKYIGRSWPTSWQTCSILGRILPKTVGLGALSFEFGRNLDQFRRRWSNCAGRLGRWDLVFSGLP